MWGLWEDVNVHMGHRLPRPSAVLHPQQAGRRPMLLLHHALHHTTTAPEVRQLLHRQPLHLRHDPCRHHEHVPRTQRLEIYERQAQPAA